tara:strand:+ start:660 stop:1172 length:513 start_codon:yes stop_codon:yes gene_type:complete
MAQVVKLKRSSVEGKTPTTSNLELGELSINTHDGRAFLKKNDGSDSIEHLITTNSQTTGSIELIGSITASGDIIPTTHITSNLGNDDNYFLTASIAHVRTFDSTIEFVDPNTKATKGSLQFTGTNGLEVKDSSNVLTTISASKVRVTEKLEANNIRFSGDLIGTITGGTF